ncbi:hypothetical protein L798_05957 [Zootermopsis nevadensis]|uniref:Uncharacterized protein n=1 Tax=Zootermopsis nevadensis TaxID=136037 RepID=A0A067R8Z5_ZOONE|nr:hypothetical protein L798_05957 [Zootermopsis nevadensis]
MMSFISERSLRFEKHLHWKYCPLLWPQIPMTAAGLSFVHLMTQVQEFPEPKKQCLLKQEAG